MHAAKTRSSDADSGLTTGHAPYVENAQNEHRLFIEQPYKLYSDENHEAWRRLYTRIQERWHAYATPTFLQGVQVLHLDAERIPRLTDVNRFLKPLTGFQAKPVSGYVPILSFFDCLRKREFPTTVTIRDMDRLDYLPEPDIFHDVAGHVPMHTNREFADTLVRFGECANAAVEIAAGRMADEERVRRVSSILRAMRRFFWFTVEFGLMQTAHGVRAYGSGLLSSYAEIRHAVESDTVQRYPIQFEWVINQGYEIFHFQPLFFMVDSFDHLFSLVSKLEEWMRSGKLDNVAPGLPDISQTDLQRFLAAARD